jgi:uncharacterized protein YpmB
MKQEDKNSIIFLLIILIIFVVVILILYYNFPKQQTNTNTCNYNSTTKVYLKNDSNCVINFLCIQGTQGFSDNCGCGCEKINAG